VAALLNACGTREHYLPSRRGFSAFARDLHHLDMNMVSLNRSRVSAKTRQWSRRARSAVAYERHIRAAKRPTILFVVDSPGWAQDAKSRNLVRCLADEFDCHIVYQDRVRERELRSSNIVVLYYWQQLRHPRIAALRSVFEAIHAHLAIGICSHFELEGERRTPGLHTLNELPAAVFANSRLLEREFAPLLDRPLYYTPNGVDCSFYTPRTSPRRPGPLRVGWAGSLTNHGDKRGYHDIIVPATNRTDGVELRTAAREDRWRGAEEMREFYRELDVYLCASRTEGTPNPCLEAAACGIPLLSTAVGNMPEFIENSQNGLIVERTVDAFADALGTLTRSPELVAAMGESARCTALTWDWKVQSDSYRAMFRDLLART